MKTVEEIKEQIEAIKSSNNTEEFNNLKEYEKDIIRSIKNGCIDILEWVISE